MIAFNIGDLSVQGREEVLNVLKRELVSYFEGSMAELAIYQCTKDVLDTSGLTDKEYAEYRDGVYSHIARKIDSGELENQPLKQRVDDYIQEYLNARMTIDDGSICELQELVKSGNTGSHQFGLNRGDSGDLYYYREGYGRLDKQTIEDALSCE